MKFLGIDYGEKRIGVAISDDGGVLAFPKAIFENNKAAISKIKNICEEENVDAVVLGESKNLDGTPNIVLNQILIFRDKIEEELNLKVFLEKEFFTSMEARRYEEGNGKIDDKAAALILQRYLDRKNKNN
jgi:putative Holliday junction resolvase